MAETNLDQVIEQYQLALNGFLKGNPDPLLNFNSQRDNLSLANPFGTMVGQKPFEETTRRVAGSVRDGKIEFENITKTLTPAMAYFVWIEHSRARFDNKETPDNYALRVTVIFIPEDGTWKLIHRHADRITSAQP